MPTLTESGVKEVKKSQDEFVNAHGLLRLVDSGFDSRRTLPIHVVMLCVVFPIEQWWIRTTRSFGRVYFCLEFDCNGLIYNRFTV